jgi:hypothetical protein
MWHTVLIATHAGAGGIALLAGCVTIARRALFGVYFGALVAMEVFLVLAVAVDWAAIGTSARILFGAFALLGLFMVWRANQARRMPLGRGYVEHVGFTLVALFDAFIVILVLNLGAPVWLVAGSGILVAVAGHVVLRAVHRRLAATRPADLRRAAAAPASGQRCTHRDRR